jgi:hypothetical protein
MAARENGYGEINGNVEGSIVLLRKATPDVGTDVRKRLYIESLTDGVTVFWQTVPAKLNSKTFRTVSSLRDWLGSKVGLCPGLLPNEAHQPSIGS